MYYFHTVVRDNGEYRIKYRCSVYGRDEFGAWDAELYEITHDGKKFDLTDAEYDALLLEEVKRDFCCGEP